MRALVASFCAATTRHCGFGGAAAVTRRRKANVSCCFRCSSATATSAKASSASSSDLLVSAVQERMNMPSYPVAKLTPRGDLSFRYTKITDVLRGCDSIHARDLFSLSLTTTTTARPDEDGGRGEGVDDFIESLGSGGNGRRPRGSSHDGHQQHHYQHQQSEQHPPPAILPRGTEILVAFGTVRALIKKDSAFIFDGHKPAIQLLAAELSEIFQDRADEAAGLRKANDRNRGRDGGGGVRVLYPDDFEIVFVEEILRHTCDTFFRRLRVYDPIVDSLMTKVDEEIFSVTGVQHLVPLKDSLQEFEMVVSQCLDCLKGVLESDEDMLGLLLTERAAAESKGVELENVMHEEVELLLEEYARQLSAIKRGIGCLLKRVQSKTDFLSISLDAYRNGLIQFDIYLSVVGLGLGMSTVTAGFFGMNLVSGMEESPTAFANVVIASSLLSIALVVGSTGYISGVRMRRAAAARQQEIETISGALGDITSVDYAIKKMINSGAPMDKKDFSDTIFECRGRHVLGSEGRSGDGGGDNEPDNEVSLLFEMLDVTKDGFIGKDDFRSMENFSAHRLSPERIKVVMQKKEAATKAFVGRSADD